MSLVFISYSHVDSETADSVAHVLDELGIEYFRDVKHIEWGRPIGAEVREALEVCVSVLVILSPASLKSQWVSYEVGFGRALHKRVLPFLTHPSLDVPGYMSDLRRLSSIDDMREYLANAPLPESVEVPESRIVLVPAGVASKIIRVMPELLAEMQQDIRSEGAELVRELVLLPSKFVPLYNTKKRFKYYEDEHADLENKIDLLEQLGLVYNVTPKTTPIYRMTEEFVDWLREAVFK
ncbi:MAG: toll/interleukin-1 receptor domain-containing protein [bacterium]